MKKRNLILGLIGCGMLFTQVVKAETLDLENISETGQNVIVGEVETPVYSVDITWGDLTFDYVYNEATTLYEWKKELNCQKLSESHKDDYNLGWLELYSDSTCTKTEIAGFGSFEDALSADTYVAYKEYAHISITDNSVNGKVTPKLYWNSESKYNYVIGNFYENIPECGLVSEGEFEPLKNKGYLFTDSACSIRSTDENSTFGEMDYYGYVNFYNKIENGSSVTNPSIGSDTYSKYDVYFDLSIDYSKEITTPVKGDTIGRITVSIEAK